VLLSGGQADEDLVADGWTDIFRNLSVVARARQGAGAEIVQLADFRKMEQVRARVDEIVRDPATAEALKPYYNQLCKRPCFHDEYLDTFNRPNVTLVDTQGRGVERITEHAVVVDGREYELDCLIYATGFEVGTGYTRRTGFEIHGRDGVALTDKWKDGAATFHGLHSLGFPNCFIVSNTQSGVTVNFPHALAEQARHIAYIVRHCTDHGVRTVEASAAAEAEWVDTIVQLSERRRAWLEECTPSYYNNEGVPSPQGARNAPYGAGSPAFFQLLAEWRAEGGLAGLELR
jgi:cyclohexanone monooxygenase